MNERIHTPVDHRETVYTRHDGLDTPAERVKTVAVVSDEGFSRTERRVRDVVAERRATLVSATRAISFGTSFLMAILGLRVFLKLIAANPGNAFAQLVYSFTDLFVGPFLTLTATPQSNGMVLELPTLIAIAIYAMLGWAAIRVLWVVFDRPGRGTSLEVEQIEDR